MTLTARLAEDQPVPADVLEELRVAEEFAEAAAEAFDICERMLEIRTAEFREAQEALDRAKRSYEASSRAETLAGQRLASLRRAEGVVRTADGYKLAKTP